MYFLYDIIREFIASSCRTLHSFVFLHKAVLLQSTLMMSSKWLRHWRQSTYVKYINPWRHHDVAMGTLELESILLSVFTRAFFFAFVFRLAIAEWDVLVFDHMLKRNKIFNSIRAWNTEECYMFTIREVASQSIIVKNKYMSIRCMNIPLGDALMINLWKSSPYKNRKDFCEIEISTLFCIYFMGSLCM